MSEKSSILPFRKPTRSGALSRAQELVFDAWEMTSKKDRVALAREALKISELCADAYLIHAQDSVKSLPKKLDLSARAVEAARGSLPREIFEKKDYPFWLDHETRPYMRSLAFLAELKWEAGQRAESLADLQKLLTLNQNDNQGIRYLLLAHLLEEKDTLRVEILLSQYDEDPSLDFEWGRFLLGYLKGRPENELVRLLHRAERANEMVIEFLMDVFSVEDVRPGEHLARDTEEAIEYIKLYGPAWDQIRGARDFVADHCEAYSD